MLKISCSNLFRYFICPAALNHEQEYIEKEKTKYAEEGIAKHLEMQEAIEGTTERLVAAEELRQEFLKIEPNFSFDHCVCEEKLELDRVLQLFGDNVGSPFVRLVGKPDLMYVSRESKTIYVIDYKFGYVDVSAKNNYQLLGYLLLCEHMWKLTGFRKVAAIFQDGRLKLEEVDVKKLVTFSHNLAQIITKGLYREYSPSPTACKWCSYRSECPALNRQVNTAVKKITETDLQQLSEPVILEFRKFLMVNKKLIEYVLNDTETFFKKNLQKGGFYDWCSLKSNGSIQSWSDDLNEDEIAEKLSELTKQDKSIFYEKKLKSVSQIKKLLDIPADLIVTKDKAKSLKIKEEHELKTATDDLF